jgi:hydrogenase-4 component B
VSDPILLFLLVDAVALIATGASVAVLPLSAAGLLTTLLSGLGLLLCVPPLLLSPQTSGFIVPAGPPGLSLHFALDPLSVFGIVVVLVAVTAVAAYQAVSVPAAAPVRMTAFCAGGAIFTLLAADGATLTLGLAATCAAIGYGRGRHLMLVPILLLAAVCLLTPSGYAPRFDAIRAAPIEADRASAAAALTLAAVGALLWPVKGERNWARDAHSVGILIALGIYLLLRVIADLSVNAGQSWWGVGLLLAGGATAVVQGWFAADSPDIDAAIAALMRCQAGLATASIGLALVARAADLAGAATFALEAACLTTVGAGIAGTLAMLSAHAIGTSAGTYRLSRLGGLIHPMPGTSAAMAASLLTLSALPPGLGFVALWLSFQSILSAPRTGGLLMQLPLAWIAAAVALSAALATAASLRVVGIALLGRPRTPRGAGAAEAGSPIRAVLLPLAGLSLGVGLLPGPLLRLLADPVVHGLTGLPSGQGLGLLSTSGSAPGYLAIPVLALMGLATGIPVLVLRRSHRRTKLAGPWNDGMQLPDGLPFGDPAAQSAGTGFLPGLPAIHRLALPRIPLFLKRPALPATTGIWAMMVAFAALLLVMTVVS